MKKLFFIFLFVSTYLYAGIPFPATTNFLLSKTNIESLIQSVALPFATVYPDGHYTYRGIRYNTTNSPSCGIQNAINLLSGVDTNGYRTTQGGTIYFSAGTFYTTTNIYIPPGSNVYTINFKGSGKASCGIMYIGTTTQSVVTIGTGFYYDVENFTMDNMFIGSDLNMATNLLYLHGNYQSNYGGAIESADIYRCWFKYGSNSTFGDLLKPAELQANLRGIDVDCNYDDVISIRDCTFNWLNCGISWACDWGVIENNQFLFCGATNYNSGLYFTNIYPSYSPYYVGACIVVKESTTYDKDHTLGGSVNGHKNYNISGNNFVLCGIHYLNTLDKDWSGGGGAYIGKLRIYNDGRENNDNAGIAATLGCRITFINSRDYLYPGHNRVYYITNVYSYVTPASDYTTWQSNIASNDLYTIYDLMNETNNVGARMLPTTNAPSSGNGLITDGNNLYWGTVTSTPGGGATNAISNTNGIGTNLVIYTKGYPTFAPTLVVTNGGVAILDTNGYQFFGASNGVVTISATNMDNSVPALLLAINTNNLNEVIVPLGYGYARSLMTTNILFSSTSTNGILWSSNNVLYFRTGSGEHLVIDGR